MNDALPASERSAALGGGDGAPSSAADSAPLAATLAQSARPSTRAIFAVVPLLVAVGVVLYLARVVFIPLTFALMLSFLLGPLVGAFARRGVPRPLGAALIVLLLFGGIGFTVAKLADPASEWLGRSPSVLETLEHKVQRWRRPVRDVTQLAERVDRITKVETSKAPQPVTLERTGFVATAFDAVWAVAVGGLVTLFALYFLLLT
ncbi:MAG TPA: AI-2E family transporter, partial [Polyangiaceae bacterium]|nr:AI-2E family transporter [Polyangiaceae bacterium]